MAAPLLPYPCSAYPLRREKWWRGRWWGAAEGRRDEVWMGRVGVEGDMWGRGSGNFS